ncbi:MAG: sulfatase-like hydrolase/transferase [Bryobacteraceae bacterium]|nr:sulfatase-like hydrolase/transferase [Bryobacteraceae bacterium]
MNRRNFLGVTGLGAAASTAVAQEVASRIESPRRFIRRKEGRRPFRARDAGRRPNVFLISIDMVSPDHWHPQRSLHREMDLPAIRSLARDGVVFNNCFTTAPLCAPARAALATGRYSYITANGERAHDGHETILRSDDVIFQEYLKASGYRTKHAGKGHLGTQKFIDAFDENAPAWDRWAPPVHDDEEYLAYLRGLGVKRARYKKELFGLQQDRASRWASWGGWIEQADGNPFPLEAQYSFYLARRAVHKLDAALEGNDGRDPVYLQLDFFDPHQPFSIPAGFEKREQALRAAFKLPASFERVRRNDWRPFPDEPKIYDFYRKNWGLYRSETALDYMVANALQMEVVDRALEHLLSAIRQRGLYEESVIVFTADHGEMNARGALVDKGVYLCPDVLRVPLIVKMPSSARVQPRAVEPPVSHLDIAPTLLDIAGLEPEARLDGQSLLPCLGGNEHGDRDLFMECGWHVGVNFACAVQRWQRGGAHHLYAYNCSDAVDELYDLNSANPVNLALKPEHKALREEMVRRMGAFLERDPRWVGYWHSFRLDRYHELPKVESGDVQMFRPI